jgi:glutathione synthase/RimK-type ligase-like ATP-grasp enzyme
MGAMSAVDLVVIHEHPEWQKPLFAALDRRGLHWKPFDLRRAAFSPEATPEAKLYFNQASPSAYLRGNTRAVPLALAYLRWLEAAGRRVLNGSVPFSLELSKSAQAALLRRLDVPTPRCIVFNDVDALCARLDGWSWPSILKPEQGGSGARMFFLTSYEELRALLESRPDLWLPDNLLLLQQYLPHDESRGIVRMEFLGGELLYAMRVVSHGTFNLCPSELCNPLQGGQGACSVPEAPPPTTTVEFFAYPEVPVEAVAIGERIFRAAGLDVGGIEYLESGGQRIFYDLNANSNLRPAIAMEYGFDPFERVVDWLVSISWGAGRNDRIRPLPAGRAAPHRERKAIPWRR